MIRLTTFGIVGALASCLVGCSGTPPGAFVILQNQVPNPDCTIPATLGTVYQGSGTLDVRVPNASYVLFPLMENDFPPPSGGSDVDGNRIALSGFDVEIGLPENFEPGPVADLIENLQALPDGDAQKTMIQYSTVTSGTIKSGGGLTSSSIVVIPSNFTAKLVDPNMTLLPAGASYTVMANLRARGSTISGSVRSDTFHYPIQICNGCLDLGCGKVGSGTACAPGQDAFVSCCQVNGGLVCQ